ncbi:Helix-turn-helix domain containing protein [uncultured Caudovirales phage]|jgi:predicted transcriptional regulator|uniref:Helix-turn-helix domain containing protein n=1 Tax=uncultured Caudovirales phage TaxID=2100421 RepID=A0A6J5M8F2_9CAUD|nr:Helix-turn-helix domain containing protein [uncultured Caudovirales phage]CAB4157936.1 Helix-turn-helix domain containing protein [uncultured Caudovirales phage]
MNAANIEKSDRLQRVLTLLKRGGEYTTLEIIQKAGVCAVNSIISELRQNGYQINCQRRADKWFYRMTT